MIVSADQLIFTNVEAEQSPTKRRGFQTLFYTHAGLNETEKLEIEARLFYAPKKEQPVKHVFFPTRMGKVVVAQIVPLTGTDRFGRTGRYFAHALIFSQEAFTQLENNPFVLFRSFPFWTTVEQALAAGELQTGNIPPVEIPLSNLQPLSSGIGLEGWSGAAQLPTLLLLAAQAHRLLEQRRAIGFFGSTKAMFQLLEVLFELLPPPLRLHCSFDTLFLEGTLSRLPYWAIGLPANQPRQPNLLIFDLNRYRFAHEVSSQPTGAFERWLTHTLERTPLTNIVHSITPAYWLGEWFEGRRADPRVLTEVDTSMFQEFAELNRPALEKRVRDRLGQQVGATLAKRIFTQSLAWTEQQGATALQYLEQGFSEMQLARWIYNVYSHARQRPNPQELQELVRFTRHHKHPELQLICLRWTQQWLSLATDLQALDDETFSWFARWALDTIPLQVERSMHYSEHGMFLGFYLTSIGLEAKEYRDLLLALLWGAAKEKPAASSTLSSRRGGVWDMAQDLLSGGKKRMSSALSELGFPTRINKHRWTFLMELLSKRSCDRWVR